MTQRSLLLALGLAGVSCTPRSPAPVPPEPEPRGEAKPRDPRPRVVPRMGTELACRAELVDGRLLVNGRDMGLELEEGLPADEVRVRAMPWDRFEILLAIGDRYPGYYMSPDQRGTLYRVPCDRPRNHTVVVRIDGADFAWAAPSPDGARLYFSYPGVGILDFEEGDWTTLTAPVGYENCWLMEAEDGITQGFDYVDGWLGEGSLRVFSGGPCGFEAEWEGGVEVIDLGAEGPAGRRKPAHVSSVLADAKQRLWASDGGLCEEAEGVLTRGRPGLWRSDDEGASWSFVTLPTTRERGIDGLWRSPADPSFMVARVECCYGSAADFCDGGGVLITRDAGDTWQAVDPPAGQKYPDDWGPARNVAIVGNGLHVGFDTFEHEQTLVSGDGGKTWRLSSGSTMFAEPSDAATLGELRFEPGPEGLVRISPDGTREVVLMPGLDE